MLSLTYVAAKTVVFDKGQRLFCTVQSKTAANGQ